MTPIKPLLTAILLLPLAVHAAADPLVPLQQANVDLRNQASLQRGAGLFVNNCMGCHSIQYMRWDRVAEDIGISTELLQSYLQVTGERPGDMMGIAMPPRDAAEWFGLAPPDLTLVTRSRGTHTRPGTDWVYTFLLSFHVDESRPLGVNNLVFPEVGMPHALWEQQGLQRAVFREDARGRQVFEGFEQITEGTMTPAEYRRAARDITAFLAYVAEPVRLERQALGYMSVLFLLILLVLAYLTKREYWKDVH
jgi:ubiquinol-cytochrome c reductase cytochrome c1 subunit